MILNCYYNHNYNYIVINKIMNKYRKKIIAKENYRNLQLQYDLK